MQRTLSKQTRRPRRGIAVMVALLALAVVASTVIVFVQTIGLERQRDAANRRRIRMDVLVRDMTELTETKKRNLEMTIPKEFSDGISDLRLESKFLDRDDRTIVTVRLRTIDDELPQNLRRDFTRSKDRIKDNVKNSVKNHVENHDKENDTKK